MFIKYIWSAFRVAKHTVKKIHLYTQVNLNLFQWFQITESISKIHFAFLLVSKLIQLVHHLWKIFFFLIWSKSILVSKLSLLKLNTFINSYVNPVSVFFKFFFCILRTIYIMLPITIKICVSICVGKCAVITTDILWRISFQNKFMYLFI